MDKVVKDVFKNCVRDDNMFNLANVKEIKFSKQLNSVILDSYSQDNIPQADIEEFERRAKTQYELNSFKINYEYTGKPMDIELQNVYDILANVNKKYGYTQDILENCKIDIDNDERVLKISLEKPFSNFLYIKRLDEYMSECINNQFGSGFRVVFKDLTELSDSYENGPKMMRLEDLNPEYSQASVDTGIPVPPPPMPPMQTGANGRTFTPRAPLTEEEKAERELAKQPQPENVIYGIDIKDPQITKIENVELDGERVTISGQIVAREERETKSGKILLTLDVTDKTYTIACKMFLDKQKFEDIGGKLKEGSFILLQGRPQFDTYTHEPSIMINNICKGEPFPERKDEAEEKRVELHLHTQMSAMDAVTSATDLVKQAIKWGHPAIAITDHGVVQSFPEANHVIMDNYAKLVPKGSSTQDILNAAPIQIIYGCEGYLVKDSPVHIPDNLDTYCVFDIETTGFDSKADGITEIAVCKVKNGEIIDEYTTFVNPEKHIPIEVQELTHITDEMVENAPTVEKMLPEFLEFTKGCVLVAHNAHFDTSFIKAKCDKLKLEFNPYVIDTLEMSREMYNGVENHKLGTLAEYLGVSLEGAHRAINDTRATARVFVKMCEDVVKEGLKVNDYIFTSIFDDSREERRKMQSNHIIILVKNRVGLKNLYKLVSYAHLWNYYKRPKINRSMLRRYREGLIVGSACERGELYQAIFKEKTGTNLDDFDSLKDIVDFYDYLEIQPLGNNEFYERKGIKIKKEDGEDEYLKLTHQDLIDINKQIISLADEAGKPCVATCDVHFKEPEDEIYRRVIEA